MRSASGSASIVVNELFLRRFSHRVAVEVDFDMGSLEATDVQVQKISSIALLYQFRGGNTSL